MWGSVAKENDNIEWDCCLFHDYVPPFTEIEKSVEVDALNKGDGGLWWIVSCVNCGEGSCRLNVKRGLHKPQCMPTYFSTAKKDVCLKECCTILCVPIRNKT